MLFLSVSLAIRFSSRFFRSINNLINASKSVGSGNLEIKVPAKKGDVVVFHNTLLNDSATHPKINPKSLHGGMPVVRGEKWMVNLWFRENLRY